MASSKIILIVDDSPVQAIVLRRILTQASFQVATAKDGVEALDLMKKQPIGLVISDINMPRMDGYELCKNIRLDPQLQQTPVILCTILSSPQDLIRGIEAGADNYIIRPFHTDNLLTLVNELLNHRAYQTVLQEKEEVIINNQKYSIGTSRQFILNFLLTSYQNMQQQNLELTQLREQLEKTNQQLASSQKEQEQLIHNIFPESVAQELLAYGSVTPLRFEDASVMFIDFVGFTKSSMNLTPQILLEALNFYFENFDSIIEKRHLERIKTIGDGYMCVGGLPKINKSHPIDCAHAALEIQEFLKESSKMVREKYQVDWKIRIGIHTGPVIAGVLGKKRFAYDIWGGTVNLASRMESHSEHNKINVSHATYERIKDQFVIEPRGPTAVKNKEGLEQYLDMYYVISAK